MTKLHIVSGGSPAEEIVKLIRELDVGLVGSRALGRLQYAIQGRIASAVVREANCPILVVHGGA